MSSAPRAPDNCVPNADGSCSICGDEAIPGVVETMQTESGTAEVRTGSGTTTVAIDLLEEVSIGDTVMVHLGFAIAHLVPGRSATMMGPGVVNAEKLI